MQNWHDLASARGSVSSRSAGAVRAGITELMDFDERADRTLRRRGRWLGARGARVALGWSGIVAVMRYFSESGVFWLPEGPERRIPGTLTFDVGGLVLVVHDSLETFVMSEDEAVGVSPEWKNFPVVLGRRHDGQDTTLLNVSGISMPGPFDATQERWEADFALTGGHTTSDAFESARFGFDALMAWADPPGIARDGEERPTLQADPREATIAEASVLDRVNLRMLTGAEGRWSHDRVHLDQWCVFEARGGGVPLRTVLDEWVRPLHDLLITCLGRPVRLDTFFVTPPGSDPHAASLRVSFPALQPPAAEALTLAQVENYNAPTLLTPRTTGFPVPALLEGWFCVHPKYRRSIALLCGPYHAPFTYAENRYTACFQAAERLAKQTLDTRELPQEQHRARVAAVTTALEKVGVDGDTVAWAKRILDRNDKPLRQLIEELAADTGAVGEALLAAAPHFPGAAAAARGGASHGASSSDALRRHWMSEALGWITRVRLLTLAGVPLADVASAATKSARFRHMLNELAEASAD